MYYVNRQQIEQRLQFIQIIINAMEDLEKNWDEGKLLDALAQERALHLAIESVTDIGSYMIDGLLMRDASSYEDIIDILHGEEVVPSDLYEILLELVKLRKPLVQDYFAFTRNNQLHPLILVLPKVLAEFVDKVNVYLDKELQ